MLLLLDAHLWLAITPKQEIFRGLVYQERRIPRISLAFVNPCATMAIIKVQSFIIIIVCFHSRSSYGFKLPYNGVNIVTYGEPCHPPRYLPVTIEVYTISIIILSYCITIQTLSDTHYCDTSFNYPIC